MIVDIEKHKQKILVKLKAEDAKDLSNNEIERVFKNTVAAKGLIRIAKRLRDTQMIDINAVNKIT